jgi:hypothetical protein
VYAISRAVVRADGRSRYDVLETPKEAACSAVTTFALRIGTLLVLKATIEEVLRFPTGS